MPELPEVQHVCQTIGRHVVGRRICHVVVKRPDVIRGPRRPANLLRGSLIHRIERLGKQMAIFGNSAGGNLRCVCIHLGMSGNLRYFPYGHRLSDRHAHIRWHLEAGGSVVFRDPRRFGGIWTYAGIEQLWSDRWGRLGPDALQITTDQLHKSLQSTRRPLKTALLDQHLIAGLGNIYVDELLHACRIHPNVASNQLTRGRVTLLIRQMRSLLHRAIEAGGSSLRDYVDGDGQPGRFQNGHRVYGRAGQPCLRCRHPLDLLRLSGRSTVFCPSCQFFY